MNKQKQIIALVGPTASGKTSLGVELALRLGGQIVSCDSMQVYRGMKIGTAAPEPGEMRGVKHHLIGYRDPRENFSAADYKKDADAAISAIEEEGSLPIIVGGTGLYLESLLSVGAFSEAECDPAVREELRAIAERDGPGALHEKLASVDPEAAAAIHKNNVKRVVRALEIFYTTGKTKTETDKEAVSRPGKYDAQIVVLDFRSRQLLYDRIDRRVDLMIENGLEGEVRALLDGGMLSDGSTAAQAIGYREMIQAIRGETTLDEAAELIKKNSRNYAKRQLTWFRRYRDRAATLYVDGDGGAIRTTDDLAEEAVERIRAAR